MTGMRLNHVVSRPPNILAELRMLEPRLTSFGLATLSLSIAAFVAAAIGPREFGGVSLWLKPAKFFLSISIFALSWIWFSGLVDDRHRSSRILRISVWALIGSATFELVYITYQAARAQASHFNIGDPLHAILYALMGLGAVTLICTNVPLAIAIAKRPAHYVDANFRIAVIYGLILPVLLGGILGGYMSSQTGHTVGVEAGHLPVVGWNRSGGDLRVAHMLGMHAEQGLPILFALVAGRSRRQRLVLLLIAAGWTVVTLLTFAQAVAGRPFPLG